MPYLGSYVEVEGPGEAEVAKVREALGLADRPPIKTSYIAMLMAYLKEHGQSPTEVTFARGAADLARAICTDRFERGFTPS